MWEEEKVFEADPEDGREKYLVTFPYPYMNGRLHLGHAFTITKADFMAGFQRLLGKNTLFPFAFHCTGMPIQAAANTLRRELEEGPAEAKTETKVGAVDPWANGALLQWMTGGACAWQQEEANITRAAGVFKSKKSKTKAKTGTSVTQRGIMRKMGIPEDEIPAFKDPIHWLHYFPPLAKADLKRFGAHVDWRRSFITTAENPYYDAFIRWHFNTLRVRGAGTQATRAMAAGGDALTARASRVWACSESRQDCLRQAAHHLLPPRRPSLHGPRQVSG